jgi:hypothetical protein
MPQVEPPNQVPPTVNTDRFFEAVNERRIADAEKELDTIRVILPPSQSTQGYLKALEGLLLTAKSNEDKYLYLAKMEKTVKNFKTLRKDFATQTRNSLHGEFDRGYFLALEGYMKKLERSGPPEEPTENSRKAD